MHFCSECGNMYYIKIDSEDNNNLIYYCRKCGNEDHHLTKENICILKTNIKKSKQEFHHLINEFTKQDPTLPRRNNIECPNNDCESHGKDKLNEVIYVRYDDENMKYIYICNFCDTTWKTDKNKN